MTDTFCRRSWTETNLNLQSMSWQSCCLTPHRPWRGDDEPFTGQIIRDRRAAHLSGQRHDDCRECWHAETLGHRSQRLKTDHGTERPKGTDPLYGTAMINLGNLCNLACRYCAPRCSSVIADRQRDPVWGTNGTSGYDTAKQQRQLAYSQIRENLHLWQDMIFTGGEATIMQEFYELMDWLDIRDKTICINTNLSMGQTWTDRLERLISDLSARGNSVKLRISLDGTGHKQEWQRQGSSWDRIMQNWQQLGRADCRLTVAMTMTMLTLEGMVDLMRFMIDASAGMRHKPCVEDSTFVLHPHQLYAGEWFWSFRDDLTAAIELSRDPRLMPHDYLATTIVSDWLNPSHRMGPSRETALATKAWLDAQDCMHPLSVPWQEIYPRVHALIQQSTTRLVA